MKRHLKASDILEAPTENAKYASVTEGERGPGGRGRQPRVRPAPGLSWPPGRQAPGRQVPRAAPAPAHTPAQKVGGRAGGRPGEGRPRQGRRPGPRAGLEARPWAGPEAGVGQGWLPPGCPAVLPRGRRPAAGAGLRPAPAATGGSPATRAVCLFTPGRVGCRGRGEAGSGPAGGEDRMGGRGWRAGGTGWPIYTAHGVAAIHCTGRGAGVQLSTLGRGGQCLRCTLPQVWGW
jgi:hypothetical protein